MNRAAYFLALAGFFCHLRAQVPPCGVVVVHSDGDKTYEQFVPARPEQVKVALLKALPAVAGEVKKNERFHIEATIGSSSALRQSVMQTNQEAGVRGAVAGLPFGKFLIDIEDSTQDAMHGSRLIIKFEKPKVLGAAVNHGNLAQPLAEETSCLAKLLSTNDPTANPRGLEIENPGTPRSAVLPQGTSLNVQLRDALWSGALKKGVTEAPVQFEVADDVVLDGAVVIRRGALATGHFTGVKQAKGYGRNAEVQFVFDNVTAVDGQTVPLNADPQKAKGGRTDQTAAIALMLPTLGWLAKGSNVLIRAGTSYEVITSGEHTIRAGR